MTIIKEFFKQIIVIIGYILTALFVLSYTHPETPISMFKQVRLIAIIYTFVVSIPVAFDSRNKVPKPLRIMFLLGFVPLIAAIVASFFQAQIKAISAYDFTVFTLSWFNYGCCIE